MTAETSDVLPSSPLILFLRWVLPAIVCVVGIALAAANGFDDDSLEGGAAIVGAGLSICLMNVLWRVGISGDSDRDAEVAARDHFDRFGRWPDESAPSR
ncbi:hypothetical protein DSM112329_00830 [Paraconexibacter sp. AEG42_29]|uniref:Transmembrane protein n=1 Tax=Paraconexibacter sp. AEG42_29 TaxID=2997339 RepID=A0AAU7AQN2_9ACTN